MDRFFVGFLSRVVRLLSASSDPLLRNSRKTGVVLSAAQRLSEFLCCLAARIRALCASSWIIKKRFVSCLKTNPARWP